MAGVKGRSGGPRPGSGRKPRDPAEIDGEDPVLFLTQVMQGAIVPSVAQLDAAKTLARLTVPAAGAGGKKEEAADRAKQVSADSRFGAAPAPLKLVKRG